MKTRYRRLTQREIDIIKRLVKRELESFDQFPHIDKDYVQEFHQLLECLDVEAPDMDQLKDEIHELKNRLTGYDLRDQLDKRNKQ